MDAIAPQPTVASRLTRLLPALVFAWSLVAFLPALRNDYVAWDDDANFVQNARWRGFGGDNLHWMLTTRHMGPWQPLSWVSLGVDHELWGPGPFGPHLGNVLYHALGALVLFFVARRIVLLARPSADVVQASFAAALAALAFALHPLRVESVAWATERRDVLSGFLLAGTVLVWLRAVSGREAGHRGGLALALVLYALSLGAKAIGMTLPVVLLALDAWPLGRLARGRRRSALLEKLPFAALALAAALVAAAGQDDVDAFVSTELLDPLDRVRIACFAALFYLGKTLWPEPLWAHYALPRDLGFGTLAFTGAVAVVLFASALLVRLRRRVPGTALAWCAYLVLLAPVSGLVLAGRQLAADRYAYLPGMVVGVWLGATALDAHRRIAGRAAWLVPLASLAVLGGWTWRTVDQIGTWRDSETLLRHVLAHEPTSVPAHNNLATLLLERGGGEAALPHLEEAALGAPREPTVVFNLARGYDAVGRTSDALAAAERAAELDPGLWQAWMLVGTRAVDADPARAVAALRRAVAIEPGFVPIRSALVRALTAAGRTDEAAREVEAAIAVPGARPAQLERLAELAGALGRDDLAQRARERAGTGAAHVRSDG